MNPSQLRTGPARVSALMERPGLLKRYPRVRRDRVVEWVAMAAAWVFPAFAIYTGAPQLF